MQIAEAFRGGEGGIVVGGIAGRLDQMNAFRWNPAIVFNVNMNDGIRRYFRCDVGNLPLLVRPGRES